MQAKEAALIAGEYTKLRPLQVEEVAHVYDALKLITLLGLSWSDESEFEETKSRIDCLNAMGRAGLVNALGWA